MRICFFSDVHGVASQLKKFFAAADQLKPDIFVLLGDCLYHGPRNGVPGTYAPTDVVDMLNERKNQIMAVRGNCDSEVDQMLLEFPIMADYAELQADNQRFFFTHGHLWNEFDLPPIQSGTILVHGHTHLPVLKKLDNGITIFNPGSISLPKGGNMPSFGFYDGSELSLVTLD